jgi:hypothetical protein
MADYAGNSYAVSIDWRPTPQDEYKTSTGVVVAKSLGNAAETAYTNLCGRTQSGTQYNWNGTLADFAASVTPNIDPCGTSPSAFSPNVQVYNIRRIEAHEDASAVKSYP